MHIQGHISPTWKEAVLLPLQGQVTSSRVHDCHVLSFFNTNVSVHVQASVADATVSYFAVISAYYSYRNTTLAADAAYLYSIVRCRSHKCDVLLSYG